jgi:hypothetical protein
MKIQIAVLVLLWIGILIMFVKGGIAKDVKRWIKLMRSDDIG